MTPPRERSIASIRALLARLKEHHQAARDTRHLLEVHVALEPTIRQLLADAEKTRSAAQRILDDPEIQDDAKELFRLYLETTSQLSADLREMLPKGRHS